MRNYRERKKDCMKRYLTTLKSVMSLIKEQSKAYWIRFCDKCSKFFFAKMKQGR